MEQSCEVSTVLYRHLTGGNAKKAAHVCGVSDKTIYAWCNGQNRVPDIQLIRLMRTFHGIARDLMGPDFVVISTTSTPFCAFETNQQISRTSHVLADAMADGVVDHTEKPILHNAFYRLAQHIHRKLPGLAA